MIRAITKILMSIVYFLLIVFTGFGTLLFYEYTGQPIMYSMSMSYLSSGLLGMILYRFTSSRGGD